MTRRAARRRGGRVAGYVGPLANVEQGFHFERNPNAGTPVVSDAVPLQLETNFSCEILLARSTLSG